MTADPALALDADANPDANPFPRGKGLPDGDALPPALAVAVEMLGDLHLKLAAALTVSDAQSVFAAATVPQLVGTARLSLLWQNRFFVLRAHAMRRMGELLDGMDKNKGGNPSFLHAVGRQQTKIADLGISYKFSSECQRIYKMPREAFDAYLRSGEQADDNLDGDYSRPHQPDYQPVELSKKELLEIASHFANKQSYEQYRATENQRQQEEVIERVDALGGSDPEPEIKLGPPPPPPDPPPPPPPEPARQLKTRTAALLRRLVDPAGNPNEAEIALRKLQETDPRLETLDDHTDDPFRNMADMHYHILQRDAADYQRLYDENNKLREAVERLNRRDRTQVATIRQLRDREQRLNGDAEHPPNADIVAAQPNYWLTYIYDSDAQDIVIGGHDSLAAAQHAVRGFLSSTTDGWDDVPDDYEALLRRVQDERPDMEFVIFPLIADGVGITALRQSIGNCKWLSLE